MTKIKASGGKEGRRERGRDGGKKRGKEGGKKGGKMEGEREGGREGSACVGREEERAPHHAQDGGRLPQEQPPVQDISAQEA